ncbi:UNVERIFIED_CONTAM: hypothetical protein FKN15_058032 [Acipenser sinensis]
MPRRKQSNPQPVKLDSEDGLGVDNSGNLVLESDFLLGQDLEFVDSDDKIIGFEKDSEDSGAEIVIPVYSLSDDDCSSYNRLSMESDAEDPRDTESDQEENCHHTLQHYLSCKQCGQLLDNSIGGLGLSTPYCLKCGADSADGVEPEEAHAAKKNSGSNRKVYSCKVCNFSSRYSNHLKRHMKTHNGEKPFTCPHCAYASAQLVNLQRHVRTHTGEKPFKCEYCAFACNSLGNLKRHERMHTQDKPNKCNLCDYRASNSRMLKRHMMGHEVEEPPLETEGAEIVIPVYSLSDDDCSSYNRLSMESDAEDPRDTESDQEENCHHTLQHYLSCKQCGQLLDNSIGGLGLSTPYCLKCGADSADGVEPEEAHAAKKNSGSNRKVYSCKVCNFSSRYSNHLKRHMKTHNGEKPFTCPHCAYASAQLVNLQRHVRTHTGEKPFKCEYCAFACNSLGNLKRHERMHTQDKPNKCNLCDYRASNSRMLKRHMMGHEVEEPPLETEDAVVSDLTLHVNSSTDFLQSYASLKPEMDPHSLLDSRDVTEESQTLPELLFPFTCRLCGLVLDDGFMHEDNSSSQICSKCGLEVLSQETPSSPEKTDKVFSCALCSFITHYPNHLARHMKTHSGEKPYKCPQCDYASAHFDNLKRHQRVHTGEKPYKCDMCDYACGNLANLKRHERVHSGAKPFKCSICNYSCNQSMNLCSVLFSDAVVSDLTLHVNSSTDFLQSYASLKPEMDPHSLLDSRDVTEESQTLPELLFPFTCRLCGLVLDDGFMHEDNSSSQICSKCGLEVLSQETPSSPEKTDKVFSCALCSFITHYPNHLARHMKTHSGEKPYKCPQCDYASAHFDNLKRHQRVHTGEKPYKCDMCDYACGNLANLKRHERVHSGAKPFKCSICNYSCNQSMNLKRHMLRHTGEKPFKCQECPYNTGHWDNYKRHQKKHGHSTEGWTKLQQAETGDES